MLKKKKYISGVGAVMLQYLKGERKHEDRTNGNKLVKETEDLQTEDS